MNLPKKKVQKETRSHEEPLGKLLHLRIGGTRNLRVEERPEKYGTKSQEVENSKNVTQPGS